MGSEDWDTRAPHPLSLIFISLDSIVSLSGLCVMTAGQEQVIRGTDGLRVHTPAHPMTGSPVSGNEV